MATTKTLTPGEQQELLARALLVPLKRSCVEARALALSAPYTPAGWAPWLEAAGRLEDATTAHAVDHEVNRFEVEAWVSLQALHPDEEEHHDRPA